MNWTPLNTPEQFCHEPMPPVHRHWLFTATVPEVVPAEDVDQTLHRQYQELSSYRISQAERGDCTSATRISSWLSYLPDGMVRISSWFHYRKD
jgi:hypothetical protein